MILLKGVQHDSGGELTESGGKEEGRERRAGAEPPAFSSSAQAPSCRSPRAALYRRSSNCSKPSGPARSPCSSSLYHKPTIRACATALRLDRDSYTQAAACPHAIWPRCNMLVRMNMDILH